MAVRISGSMELVAGGLKPNARVDVMRTNDQGAKKLVLDNILVLAVEQPPVRPKDKPGERHFTVTLELTPEQAETLAKEPKGSITLASHPSGRERKESIERDKP